MVDVPTQLQSVTRTYRLEERDGQPVHVQTLEQTYPAFLTLAGTERYLAEGMERASTGSIPTQVQPYEREVVEEREAA